VPPPDTPTPFSRVTRARALIAGLFARENCILSQCFVRPQNLPRRPRTEYETHARGQRPSSHRKRHSRAARRYKPSG